MKKRISIAVAALAAAATVYAASFVNYKPANIVIGATSVLILPDVGQQTTNRWATGAANAYGKFILESNQTLWCVSAGNSDTVLFAVPTDGDVTDGTTTWRVLHRVRNQVMIRNMSTTEKINLGFGYTAVADKGVSIRACEGWISDTGPACPQGNIYAVASGANTTVAIQEN